MKYEGLTDKERKGFDIVVKFLNKRYPFVVGWDEYKDWKTFTTNLYINLIVDLTKYKEYFKVDTWGGVRIDYPYVSLTDPLYGSKDYNKVREVQDLIGDMMKRSYESLPEEYTVEYKTNYTFDDTRYVRFLGIGSFVFINPPSSAPEELYDPLDNPDAPF